MYQSAKELLMVLTQYLEYLYPGFITLSVYDFVRGIKFKESKESLIKSIVISFIYVDILFPFFDSIVKGIATAAGNPDISLNNIRSFVLVIMAVVFPYLWWKLRCAKSKKWLLKKIGINTNVYDNPLDIATSMEDSVWISVYMDDLGIMYEGALRNYVSDLEHAQYLMISDYRISKLDKNKNEYVQTFPAPESEKKKKHKDKNNENDNDNGILNVVVKPGNNKSSEWAVLDRTKITRIELLFNDAH